MRKFGTDAPEFLSFTLGDDETVYQLPLAQHLPAETLIEMQEASEKGEASMLRFQLGLLAKYIGEDAAKGLPMAVVREIYEAWTEDSRMAGGDPGE